MKGKFHDMNRVWKEMTAYALAVEITACSRTATGCRQFQIIVSIDRKISEYWSMGHSMQ